MTTSRTGTTRHKQWRTRVITRAKNQNQTTCPLCGVPLNYHTPRQPNSAEADHIIPYAQGGTDTLENGRVICRQCNQKLGAITGNARKNRHKIYIVKPTDNRSQW